MINAIMFTRYSLEAWRGELGAQFGPWPTITILATTFLTLVFWFFWVFSFVEVRVIKGIRHAA